ncbi:DUF6173 family protein [Paracoccus tegillarcae]|uniref:Uncharacterized protein n=1 Tax=Paracoccus tegillarcae TaxID=1529068 RepID=A0A2K9F2U6_9RHOB|nr:DUF6173 family protein [Paracoccus tegillarcae]AUH33461.1 hypothetical protein CUV01_08715 [Paracoccus tegillarcae]
MFKSKKPRTEPKLRKPVASEAQPTAPTPKVASRPATAPQTSEPTAGPAFAGAPSIAAPASFAVPALAPDLWPTEDAADEAALHAAEHVFKHLLARVKNFQENLPDHHELGIQLANFGGVKPLHVRGMGFKNPNVIEFYGLLDGDKKVAVVQHVSQLNFLLIAVPPVAEQQPYRIGFGAELREAEKPA